MEGTKDTITITLTRVELEKILVNFCLWFFGNIDLFLAHLF
jgi:hypothetical protein